jgi:small subunit ribosomal protein S2
MEELSIRALVDAGAHFGHRAGRWNPKMAPYIKARRNQIHIIDLRETVKGILRATHFVREMAATGEDVLIVGTKRQARPIVAREATRCKMPFVSERWLGGTLTNFNTIRRRLKRLAELEEGRTGGGFSRLKKKEISRLAREERKIRRNLEGIKDMSRLPGAMIIIDPRMEHIAVAEAQKMNIPAVAMLDTDCDPSIVDIPVPANDDSIRAIDIILARLADAMLEGHKLYVQRQEEAAARAEAAPPVPAPTGNAPPPDPDALMPPPTARAGLDAVQERPTKDQVIQPPPEPPADPKVEPDGKDSGA